MLISELLNEKMTSDVYINADKKLYLISDLIEKTFGVKIANIRGTCLAAQVIYTLSSISKLHPSIFVEILEDSNIEGGFAGVTLESLIDVFSNPIEVKDEMWKFNISINVLNLDECISEIKAGQPCIFIPSRKIQTRFDRIDDDESYYTNRSSKELEGIVNLDGNLGDLTSQSTFHALLVVGYDADGYLIVRENRSLYGYKGYYKFEISKLSKKQRSYKILTVNVDSIEKKKIKK